MNVSAKETEMVSEYINISNSSSQMEINNFKNKVTIKFNFQRPALQELKNKKKT